MSILPYASRPNLAANNPPSDATGVVARVAGQVGLFTDLPIYPARDAFQRLRVSEPATLFDSKMLSDNLPLVYDDQPTSGAGTSSNFSSARASVTLGVSAATAGTRVRQTFRRFNYQPGKSQLILLTGVLGAGAAGITKRCGLFDGSNGVFFQLSGTTLSVVIRSSVTGAPVDTVVPQASWNIDPMDGTGPSGLTLDTTKAQIFVADFQWLGVGTVRYGVSIGGVIYYVHAANHSNSITSVYDSTPNLPVRWEISNSGAGGASSVEVICATVISEGGRQTGGYDRVADRGVTPLVTLNNNSLYPLIAIRLRAGSYLGAQVIPNLLSVLCTSTAAYRWALLLNPTVVGAALAFTPVAAASSAVESDAVATNASTVTGGTVLRSGYSQSNNESAVLADPQTDFALGSSIAGTADILVLAVQRLTGTTETFYGSLGWREAN